MPLKIVSLAIVFALTAATHAESKIGVSLAKSCDRELEDSRVQNIRTTCPAGKDDACLSTATKREMPTVPAAAKKSGAAGCVFVLYDVENGLADKFRVMKEVPAKQGFSQAVLDALMKWEFKKNIKVKNQKIVVSFEKGAKPVIHEQKL